MSPRTGKTDADREIIAQLRAGAPQTDAALRTLYWQYYPAVKQTIFKFKGSEADAEDIFQDTLIIFYEQVIENKFRGDSSIKSYLTIVARNMWFTKLKKRKVALAFTEAAQSDPQVSASPIEIMLEEEKHNILLALLAKLEDRCREILGYRLYDRLSMTEISEKMGFANEQNARNKHYKCKKALKSLAEADPLIKTILPSIK